MVYLPNGLVRRCFIPGEEKNSSPGFKTVKGSEKYRTKLDSTPTGVHPLELTSTLNPLSRHLENLTLVTGLDRPYKLGGDAHEQGAS